MKIRILIGAMFYSFSFFKFSFPQCYDNSTVNKGINLETFQYNLLYWIHLYYLHNDIFLKRLQKDNLFYILVEREFLKCDICIKFYNFI